MKFFRKIEDKWQKKWEKARIFEANPDSRKKFFLTVPYPYCSGSLHIGHGRTYTIGDIVARFKRMRGFNVLWPMAFHVTGTPVFSISKRIKLGEEEVVDLYREYVQTYETDPKMIEKILESFKEPWNVAKYFSNMIVSDFKTLGFSIDWRRTFTTGDAEYNSFVTWQFNKLNERKYITKGEYPILYCQNCENAVGEDDIARGDEIKASVGEYVLVKFTLGDSLLVAATMRPETILGVTNIWINPEGMYVKAHVDDEQWIISEDAAKKLAKQGRKVTITENFTGRILIGKYVKAPILHKEIMVLPGTFVDVDEATGVVYSVPAHAPWDYIGLKDLKDHPEKVNAYGIKLQDVSRIDPIPIITMEGYGRLPAVDEVERFEVEGLDDREAIDKATESIYKAEFYNGVMTSACNTYSGLTVQQAKERISEDLSNQAMADRMYEVMSLEKPVECRCGGDVIVAVLSDQWFINYGNEEWKRLARDCLTSMKVSPQIYRKLFEDTVEWLHERPCARKRGIGTKLPWDRKWIIESLSDSTIYMCVYTIIHYIKKNDIKPEQLKAAFWNYVLLDEGNLEDIQRETGIDRNVLEEMKTEYEYWYPNDQRHSSIGHITNHLTFFIFNHAAVFQKKYWPKMISLNEYVLREGAKMSKSRGNVTPLVSIPKQYCADLYRLYIAFTADLSSTVDWRAANIQDLTGKLESFRRFATTVIHNARTSENGHMERWLMSSMQHRITEVTKNLVEMKTRTAVETAFFRIWNDLRWYIQRKGNGDSQTLNKALKIWLKLLAPFTPHLCEELWSQSGEKTFISQAEWPVVDRKLVDVESEERENLIKDVISDTLKILKATKMVPQKIHFYTAASWKWDVYLKILADLQKGKVLISQLVKDRSTKETSKSRLKEVAKFASKIVSETEMVPEERRTTLLKAGQIQEKQIIQEAMDFLSSRLNAKITVSIEDEQGLYDPRNRATHSMPYRPAIYIE